MPENREGSGVPEGEEPKEQNTLEELMEKYPTFSDIPDSLLKEIGYVKVRLTSGGIKLALEKRIQEERELKEKREAMAPFGRIFVKTEKKSVGRIIEGDKLRILIEKHFTKYENVRDGFLGKKEFYHMEELCGSGSAIDALYKKLLQYSNEDELENVYKKFNMPSIIQYEHTINDLFIDAFGKTFDRAESLISMEVRNIDTQDEVSSQESEKIYNDIERLQGRLSDPDFYKQEFNEVMAKNFSDEYAGLEFPEKITYFELSKYFFVLLFKEYDQLRPLAEVLSSCKSPEEVVEKLEGVTFPELKKSIKEAKKKKAVTKQEQTEKSNAIKMLSSQLKESEQILAGVIEYYSMPNITATLFDRGIEEFQKKLVRGSKENTEEVFTLDGTPNDELDRNPGKMSGDCTDGLPLPFGDPNIPLFNIKVFKGEGNHMGNIYLLETQDEEKRQVWHLDAIQVPASVDWDKFIKTFFDALFAEAEKKGVAGITVNDESHHISNYDYISKAVLDYLEKSGIDETIKIDYPKYKKKGYSHLQTDGNVFFIPVPNK